MSDQVEIIITIKMPKPSMNMASLTNIVGQKAFKNLKLVLTELGVNFTEITCRHNKL